MCSRDPYDAFKLTAKGMLCIYEGCNALFVVVHVLLPLHTPFVSVENCNLKHAQWDLLPREGA